MQTRVLNLKCRTCGRAQQITLTGYVARFLGLGDQPTKQGKYAATHVTETL